MRDTNIYGDIHSYGDYLDKPFEPDFVVDPNFKIKWPVGYWESYDKLAIEAKTTSKADHVCIVVLLSGKYQVQAKKAHGAQFRTFNGPESHDRLIAWREFIELVLRTNGKAT